MKTLFKSIALTLLICLGSTYSFAQSETKAVATTDTTMLVNGVCDMCKRTIEKAAKLKGVEKAEWNVETKVLTISYQTQAVTLSEIAAAINKSGYDTEYGAALEEDYQKLNPCCHYRDPAVIDAH
jgi:copper chaperone CopZ